MNNKTVVIVGIAGQVGWATAQRLANSGARIIGLAHNPESIQNQFMMLANSQRQHRLLMVDITDSSQLRAIASEIEVCDVLVNAVGKYNSTPATDIAALNDEIFDELLTVNLRGVFATIREFLPLLQQQEHAVIINIGSQSSQQASNSNIAYSCAKAGLDLMTRTLAPILAPNIRIINLAPGHMAKSMSGITRSQELVEIMRNRSVLKHLITGEEVAAAVECYITTITHVTGQTILLDGGTVL
jgi:NAD(P)-dependent dehydrogenase (short-subunit alcohol dehydrogenase family)